MFGVDVLTQPQIDAIVLEFPIPPPSREWRGSKSRFWFRKTPKSGGFRP